MKRRRTRKSAGCSGREGTRDLCLRFASSFIMVATSSLNLAALAAAFSEATALVAISEKLGFYRKTSHSCKARGRKAPLQAVDRLVPVSLLPGFQGDERAAAHHCAKKCLLAVQAPPQESLSAPRRGDRTQQVPHWCPGNSMGQHCDQ